jgi:hypothetical protein
MATNFGRDISCTTGLRSGRYASGRRLVAEACYRRLSTPRGMLRGGDEEADYGIDLSEYLGASRPKAAAASLPAIIEAELRKDERVEQVDTTVTLTSNGVASELLLTVRVTTGEGPFDLQVSVDEVSVELLGIST